MPRVIEIPELLGYIFIYLDRKSLAAAARTNKFWSEHALDVLWKHLPTVTPILELMSPLHCVNAGDNENIDTYSEFYDDSRSQKWVSCVTFLLRTYLYFFIPTSRYFPPQ